MAGLEEAQPKRGFGPAPEVLSYFEGKQLAPRFSWLDVWGEEHASAFTVAKATELELLTAFRDSIRAALEKGQGLETWKAGIEPELRRLGWWGRRPVIDPTGQDKPRMVDFSSPRRLKNLFWSNMNSARAAGQWDRIQRTKRALPYLLYVRTTAAEPRQEHLTWVGVILPADDPFWRTHFPPNGWGCKCTVRQITRRERERLLSSASEAKFYSPDRPVIEMKPFVNRRTGEVTYVPEGIDPGWHTNPGMPARRRLLDETLAGRVETTAADPTLHNSARKAVAEIVEGAAFVDHRDGAIALDARRKAVQADALARGQSEAEAKRLVETEAPWSHAPLPIAVLPPRVSDRLGPAPLVVTVTDNAIAHSVAAHPIEIAAWRRVQDVLDRGEVHLDDTGEKLWAFLREEAVDWMLVLVNKAGGWRLLTYYKPSSASYRDRQRQRPGRQVILNENAGGGP
ncbi:hypothetical protein C3941_09375 [Kaistia algarum]|uniref:phage head morphogenesis protein n=1 Tax=Kaistia algarum TaxID=2083279 RepID=UPI000CE797BF|nr:phage minor head protein [Kaistia algarum]MCX5512270.1 phage minor head protein [Kaistia algarum]PPE80360.1 hypothetical protein C3941_09375 [Kaistia algarum]